MESLHPVIGSYLNTHREKLDNTVKYGSVTEKDHICQLFDGHIAVYYLISKTVLLNKLCFVFNHTEKVQRHICLLSRNASLLIRLNELLNKTVEILSHLYKGALLRLEHGIHACESVATLSIHKLDIVNSLARIGGGGISYPNALRARTIVQIAVKKNISRRFKKALCLLFGVCLSHLDGLNIYLFFYRPLNGLGKNIQRQ